MTGDEEEEILRVGASYQRLLDMHAELEHDRNRERDVFVRSIHRIVRDDLRPRYACAACLHPFGQHVIGHAPCLEGLSDAQMAAGDPPTCTCAGYTAP